MFDGSSSLSVSLAAGYRYRLIARRTSCGGCDLSDTSTVARGEAIAADWRVGQGVFGLRWSRGDEAWSDWSCGRQTHVLVMTWVGPTGLSVLPLWLSWRKGKASHAASGLLGKNIDKLDTYIEATMKLLLEFLHLKEHCCPLASTEPVFSMPPMTKPRQKTTREGDPREFSTCCLLTSIYSTS